MIFFALMICSLMLFAQVGKDIDLPALIDIAYLIALIGVGVGGYSVTALVSIIKRWFNATGFWVVLISIGVSAICVMAYLLLAGWDWLSFLILTAMVTALANGIHLKNKKRNK